MEALSLSTCLTVVGILLPTTPRVWSLGEHHSGMNVTKGRGVHRRDDRDKAVTQSGRQTNESDWKADSWSGHQTNGSYWKADSQSGRQTNGSYWKADSQSGRQTNGSDWKADSRSRRQTNGSDWKADSWSGHQTNGSDWKADRVTSVHQSLLQTRDLLHESEHGGSPALYTWEKGKQTAEEFLHGYCSLECFSEKRNIYSPGSQDSNLADPFMNTRALLIKPKPLDCGTVACFTCYCKQTFPGGDYISIEPDIPIDLSYLDMPWMPLPKRPVEDSVSEVPTTSGTVSDGKETEQKADRHCVMGNCCPKRPPSDFQPHDLTNGRYTGCLAGLGHRFLAVVRCPEQHPDPTLRQECEHGKGNFTTDEPVTDLATQVVYRNPHCAKCHGVDRYTPWRLEVDCKHFQYLYTVRSELELLREVSDADTKAYKVCTMNHSPPVGSSPKPCGPFFKDSVPGPFIHTCNVTGLWSKLDEDVQTNCAKFTALHFRVRELSHPYRLFMNLFCTLCNGVQLYATPCNVLIHYKPPLPGPLTFLLGLQDRRETSAVTVDTCTAGQWLSFDKVCRNVSCSAGKQLDAQNRTCSTAVKQIRGLAYRLDFVLVPRQRPVKLALNQDRKVYHSFKKTFKAKTDHITFQASVKSWIALGETRQENRTESEVIKIRVSASLVTSMHYERDEVEQTMVDSLLLQDWVLAFREGQRVHSHKFAAVPTGYENITDVYNRTATTEYTYSEDNLHELMTRENVAHLFSERILLNRLLICPFTNFTDSEFQFLEENTTGKNATTEVKDSPKKVGIVLMQEKFIFSDLHFSWMLGQDGRLHVCLDTLEKLHSKSPDSQLVSSSWQYFLSMTVMPCSIVCLAVVLLVYVLLPELRSQPGLNTMGTCFTLLCAQLCLLLALHRVLSGVWCRVLGVVVHVSWLSTFCWTLVSSVHMFRAFSGTSSHRWGDVSYRILANNVALTLLVPGVVVSMVIGLSWYHSGGQSIGYNGYTCYLQSSLVVGLSVVLPIALVVAVNIVLYIVTICRIHQVCKLRDQAEMEMVTRRQHMKASLRLSLLTGVTWLLSLVAEGVDLDWLRAVSILTNGGQGMLLLLSHVTTRRVAAMVVSKRGGRGSNESSFSFPSTTSP